MKFKIIIFVLFFLCATSLFAYEDIREMSLSAQGIEKLEIDCGAGYLKVFGKKGLSEIKVEAEIVLDGRSEKSAEEFLRKYLDLSLEKKGRRAVLTSGFESYGSLFSFGSKVINLTVSMPQDMDLDVDDGSGSTIIEDIAGDVNVDDGSGDTEITNITGNLVVDDGSGDLEIMNIKGSLEVDDGSGTIDVNDVSGDVSVDDGSGSISIRNIGGSVIVRDGSGSITIDGVEKDVRIPSDGSGSVRVNNVKGTVKY